MTLRTRLNTTDARHTHVQKLVAIAPQDVASRAAKRIIKINYTGERPNQREADVVSFQNPARRFRKGGIPSNMEKNTRRVRGLHHESLESR